MQTNLFGSTQYFDEFIDLAQTLNFHETAANLLTSQSNISKHIAKLEKNLGVPLFNRNSKTVILSEYGKAFYEYSKEILKLSEQLTNDINQIKTTINRTITIGFVPFLGQYGFFDLSHSFGQINPDITINTIECYYPNEMLKNYQCDIVMDVENDHNTSGLNKILYQRDHLVAVLYSDHPLANEKSIRLEQLKNDKFIECSTPTSSAFNFRKLCQDNGFIPNIYASISRSSTIVEFVSKGNGSAVLFRKRIPYNIESVKVVDIVPEIPVNICAYYLQREEMPVALKSFIDFLNERSSFTK